MRITTGQKAPQIAGKSTSGRTVSLVQMRGGTVLVKFLRFAACPVCNLHIREFARRNDELAEVGITTIVVYHSPVGKINRRLGGLELPFDVIEDPDKTAFAAYGVEQSIRGMFTPRVMRDYMRAMRAGIFSRPLGHEGGIKGHPADFLIDGGGIVRIAHYGSDYADTMLVDDVLVEAADLGLTAASQRSP